MVVELIMEALKLNDVKDLAPYLKVLAPVENAVDIFIATKLEPMDAAMKITYDIEHQNWDRFCSNFGFLLTPDKIC